MAEARRLFTSESVTMGHPDKVADQISDAVLDAIYEEDPMGRVACETLVATGLVVLAGEITTTATVDYQDVARETVRRIGYTDSKVGFDAGSCAVLTALNKQSPDISQGVTAGEGLHAEQGAGDQGMMFGYACDHTAELMPMPIMLAHRLVHQLTKLRQDGTIKWLRPDGKTQVTVEYDNGRPGRVDAVVVSTQHHDCVPYEKIRETLIDACVKSVIEPELLDADTKYHINPTGRFVVGGPHGDSGLTGRKIIVDTYGGWGRHGGGAFSGKDPSKVDRSATYMARHIAKNIVAAGLTPECEVQLAYAIGVAEPVSVLVETNGQAKVPETKIAEAVREVFPLKPAGIIEYLDLRRPIFTATAAGGHFGRDEDEFTWEKTDKVDDLRQATL